MAVDCWIDDEYYVDSNGIMVTDSWLKEDCSSQADGGTAWYYFDGDGEAVKEGWKKINNVWYYFNDVGVMQTGWVDENRYYTNESGQMLTGWQLLDPPEDASYDLSLIHIQMCIRDRYTAELSADAKAGSYLNTAWVSYLDEESAPDVVIVRTYGINIFKYDSVTNGGLAGAEFELKDSTGGVIATVTSGENGYIRIDGLDEGEYTLTETKAPDGYVKSCLLYTSGISVVCS